MSGLPILNQYAIVANLKKRLIKSPKIYIRDSGLYHTLIGVSSFQALTGHSILGMSWEGFCLEQILNRLPRGWGAYFYRTQAGAEVDLILQRRFGEAPILIEFKYSQSPKLSKGFWEAKKDLQPKACYVFCPGIQPYPLEKSVEVLPLSAIEKIWKE